MPEQSNAVGHFLPTIGLWAALGVWIALTAFFLFLLFQIWKTWHDTKQRNPQVPELPLPTTESVVMQVSDGTTGTRLEPTKRITFTNLGTPPEAPKRKAACLRSPSLDS